MTGFSKNRQQAMLFAELNKTLYLRIFYGTNVGDELNDDGTLPTGVHQPSDDGTKGYAPIAVNANDWSSGTFALADVSKGALGVASAATLKATKTFTQSGASNWGDIVCWALTTDGANSYTDADKDDFVCGGPITDGSGAPTKITIAGNGQQLIFDSSNPITARMGDPPFVSGSRVVPI